MQLILQPFFALLLKLHCWQCVPDKFGYNNNNNNSNNNFLWHTEHAAAMLKPIWSSCGSVNACILHVVAVLHRQRSARMKVVR